MLCRPSRLLLIVITGWATLPDLDAAPAAKSTTARDDFNRKAAQLFHQHYSFHPWDESDHTVAGEDWSLPPWVKAAPYSGIKIDPKRVPADFPARIQREVRAEWREIEPREGALNFEGLRTAMLQASEGGKRAVKLGLGASVWETRYFRALNDPAIERITPGTAPAWMKALGVPIIAEKPNSSIPFQVVNLDIYHPAYHARYLRMIEALGRSGIPQMPELDLCYVHLVSPSRGEEGRGPPVGDPRRAIYEERLRAWAAAFRGVEYKLCHVSSAPEDLELCLRLGMGQRNGFVEHYLLHTQNPMLGQSLDPAGYLVVDERNPMIAENRASGDENEEYSAGHVVRFGPIETFPHRYHESMLRVLQMRRNFLWAEGGPWLINPPLLHYVALELGQTARTAPDAWCYLRESYVPDRRPGAPAGRVAAVKNFERWLFQRDSDGARTEATERVEVTPQMFEYAKTQRYDETARKTLTAEGQRLIRFGVEEAFLAGGPHAVAVKVTALDRGHAAWALEYRRADGSWAGRSVVAGGDTGEVKTVTFILRDACFPEGGPGGADLQIRAVRGDAVIRMVRVIKLAP